MLASLWDGVEKKEANKWEEWMENPGYCSGSFDGLHHPSDDDDDDEMVDIAGATLDFSSTDDVPPLSFVWTDNEVGSLLHTTLNYKTVKTQEKHKKHS
uniref:Uncharacterized protein n=1 Tax=Amphilophus citrinellus TaxID=61819 RepID=A0A3Q0R8H0_AMPCI